jgi:4-amino-4-deoxy-L-arabinose transferase-like glycosyltransferase
VTATTTPGIQRRALGWPLQAWSWLREAARQNRLFTLALAGGALLRLIVVIGYPGALWFAGDSYVYLGAALRPQPNLSKTTGYSLFLRMLLPFHSLTLVVVCQHLMGLANAVMIYALLRRNGVSKKWSAIATVPVLFDGFMIENEHQIMTEALFTFCVMVALTLTLWKRRTPWWTALIIGLLLGYAAIVRTEGIVFLPIFPLFVLARGWRVYGWKKARAWIAAIVMSVGCIAPVLGYALWFQSYSGSFGLTLSQGYYLWGRVSSFADCAVIKPTGMEAVVCPTQPIAKRTPPGNFIWHASEVHQALASTGGPVSKTNNKLLTDFAIHAVEAQPLGYAKSVARGVILSFLPQREDYPGVGTVYYYHFHRHEIAIPHHVWIRGGNVSHDTADQDWAAYGHQKAGVAIEPFAAALIAYQRVFWTWGPLLAVIMLMGLGGRFKVRRPRDWRPVRLRRLPVYWAPRGTSMFPWVVSVVMLLTPIAIADFDYRYLLPVIPFACLAAGLAFAPPRGGANASTQERASGQPVESITPEITSV